MSAATAQTVDAWGHSITIGEASKAAAPTPVCTAALEYAHLGTRLLLKTGHEGAKGRVVAKHRHPRPRPAQNHQCDVQLAGYGWQLFLKAAVAQNGVGIHPLGGRLLAGHSQLEAPHPVELPLHVHHQGSGNAVQKACVGYVEKDELVAPLPSQGYCPCLGLGALFTTSRGTQDLAHSNLLHRRAVQ